MLTCRRRMSYASLYANKLNNQNKRQRRQSSKVFLNYIQICKHALTLSRYWRLVLLKAAMSARRHYFYLKTIQILLLVSQSPGKYFLPLNRRRQKMFSWLLRLIEEPKNYIIWLLNLLKGLEMLLNHFYFGFNIFYRKIKKITTIRGALF